MFVDELRISDNHTQLWKRERERVVTSTLRETVCYNSPHRHRQTDMEDEKRLTSTLVPSPLGSLEAASRTAGNTSHDTVHSVEIFYISMERQAIANSPRERMVTQFGRSGMRRAWPRALLPVSFLYALAPCVEGQRERERERVAS